MFRRKYTREKRANNMTTHPHIRLKRIAIKQDGQKKHNTIDEDGSSQRMREQVDYLNRAVGWLRYFAEILIRGITGKAKARQIEDDHVDAYREKHGRNPRGNVKKTRNQ